MHFTIIDMDGTLLDEIKFVDKKPVMSARDATNSMRRQNYHQQAHIQRALRSVEVIKKRKAISIEVGCKQTILYDPDVGPSAVCICGRYTLAGTAEIKKNLKGKCSVASVKTCGSVWACPVCCGKIMHTRVKEIREAVKHFKEAPKWMVTLTARHDRDTDLKEFATKFRNARRRLSRNRHFEKWRRESGGYITAAEITWSPRNGWHWHVHELWFDTPSKPNWAKLWQTQLEKEGLSCTIKNGYNVQESWDASEYIAKMGEIGIDLADDHERKWDTAKETASPRKGQSIWQLATTRPDLIREHFLATRGMRRLSWSPGLKKAVNLEEIMDAELAEMDEGTLVVEIDGKSWAQIHKNHAVSDVLESAELGGAKLVQSFIRQLEEGEWDYEKTKETIIRNREFRAVYAQAKKENYND